MRHILALSTAAGLVLPAVPAHAQTAETTNMGIAPPARVGQIASVHGSVSFNGQSTSGWTTAQINYPVSTGDTLYTQPDAEAAIAVDWSRITLSGGTEFAVTALDNQTLQATEAQGETYLDLRYLPQGGQFVVTTPRGTVTISRNGRYDIIAGDQNTPTEVTVISGAATVNGQDVALSVAPGQTAMLNGANPVTASLDGARTDPFMARMARYHIASPPAYVPPAVSQMTGADELSQYGSWSQASQYGAVWYPHVASDWVPYRSGHWTYVAPWGWTWVASEPWGFAPFHYGRWVDIGGRWGWAPSPVQSAGYDYGQSYSSYYSQNYSSYYQPSYAQPVYAPALVSFFSVGTGVALAAGFAAGALAAGSVGWVPLAPNEPYYPPYRCPPQYIRRINVMNVRNVTNITRINNVNNTTVINNYDPARLVNRRAATVLPAAAMRQGDPVARFGHPAPQTVLAAARSIPPANIRATPHPGPAGHPAPAIARLPAAPTPLAHRAPAPAPKPAAFAMARGLPVAHPAPVKPAAARVLGVPAAHGGNQPAPHGPAPINHAPAINHPVVPRPAAIHPPSVPARPANQPVNHPQAHFAAPGFQDQLRHVPQPPQAPRAPAQQHAAQHVQAPGRPPAAAYHSPVQQQHPVYHQPVQQPRSEFHPPVQQRPVYHPPVQQPRSEFHPPVQQRPVYHPQVQQPRPEFHPPVQQPRPEFHPPVQQPRQALHPAPAGPERRPQP